MKKVKFFFWTTWKR